MSHVRTMLGAVVLALFAACASPDATGISPTPRVAAAHTPDLTGTPDLVVASNVLASSWVVYDEFISGTSCTAIEGGVPEGDHRLLRVTVTTPNIGDADVAIGDPNVHFDPNGDGDPSDGDGLFEFATCHRHYHFRNYATYELYPVLPNGSLGTVIVAAKRGFCMIDVTPYSTPKSWFYRSCGRPAVPSLGLAAIPGNQGISAGWADTYVKFLTGQFFVVDNLPGGKYLIRITVNPAFNQVAGQPCPVFDPQAGKCHNFFESDYDNNVGEVYITLPADRPGKLGWGPGGNQLPPNNAQSLIDDENRPNK